MRKYQTCNDADDAGDDDEEQALLPSEIDTGHEEQLQIAPAHAVAAQNPIGDEHDDGEGNDNRNAPDKGLEEQGSRIEAVQPPRQEDVDRPHSKSGDDATVRNKVFVDVGQRKHQQNAREAHQLNRFETGVVAQNEGDKSQRAKQLGKRIAYGYPLAAIAASALRSQPAEKGHEIAGSEHVVARRAMGSSPHNRFAMDDTPRQTIQKTTGNQTDHSCDSDDIGSQDWRYLQKHTILSEPGTKAEQNLHPP